MVFYLPAQIYAKIAKGVFRSDGYGISEKVRSNSFHWWGRAQLKGPLGVAWRGGSIVARYGVFSMGRTSDFQCSWTCIWRASSASVGRNGFFPINTVLLLLLLCLLKLRQPLRCNADGILSSNDQASLINLEESKSQVASAISKYEQFSDQPSYEYKVQHCLPLHRRSHFLMPR